MMEKKSCQLIITSMLTAALCLEAVVLRQDVFVLAPKSWPSAREECRLKYVDLIPAEVAFQLGMLSTLASYSPKVLVGNYRILVNNEKTWKRISLRSGGEETLWKPTSTDDECAILFPSSGFVTGIPCTASHPFACLGDNLVLVKENKTWEEALQHCHDMETKCDSWKPCFGFLTLKHDDYDYVRDRIYDADTDEVWTGLRFLGGHWFWLDGEKVEDEEQLPRCPSQRKHCGTLSKFDTNKWITRDCSEKRNFICVKNLD